MTNADMADRQTSGATAVDEVAHVIVGDIQALGVGRQRLGQQLLVTGADGAAAANW